MVPVFQYLLQVRVAISNFRLIYSVKISNPQLLLVVWRLM